MATIAAMDLTSGGAPTATAELINQANGQTKVMSTTATARPVYTGNVVTIQNAVVAPSVAYGF